ncbi:MAG TPA: FAD-dependent oxidoreductase, partial [Spirochaetia bacterium]|nr:FAD-dependent oxidoreductase [Spirochaetia bacterium]
KRLLDSITLNHAVDPVSAEWSRRTGGAVFELHCYALPRDGLTDGEVRNGLLQELTDHLPDLAGASVVHEHLQVRHDFTAFHTGMHGTRPGPVTALPQLVLAGDWVRLPIPAMLMEAACTSAIIAANAVLDRVGLRQEPFWSVPETGLFARS